MYEMLKPPKYKEVTYLRVVSAPRWCGGISPDVNIPELKIGSITWTHDFTDKITILENNQFSINFDSKCFEEIKMKYRFKTKKEFLKEGRWNSDEMAPIDWNYDMNEYLGKSVPFEFYNHCNESRGFQYEGWFFNSNDYTDKPLKKTTLETKESLYRFKTEEEFKRDGLWDDGFPRFWNSKGEMNHYMGKPINSDYNAKCDNEERLTIHDEYNDLTWVFSPDDYVLISDFPLREDSIRVKPLTIEDCVPEHSDLLSTSKKVLGENPFKKVDEFIQREKDEKQKTSVKNDFTQMININI